MYMSCKSNILHIAGGSPNGGGGGGGRIAVYYTGDHYYNGQLLTHGGRGNGHHGGTGTMYLAQVRGTAAVRRTLTVDNARLTSSERIAEVERLDLAGNVVSANSMSFTTYGGLRFTTNGTVFCYDCVYYNHHRYQSFFFIRSGVNKPDEYYRSTKNQATIEVELPFLTYIDHVDVYPHCEE